MNSYISPLCRVEFSPFVRPSYQLCRACSITPSAWCSLLIAFLFRVTAGLALFKNTSFLLSMNIVVGYSTLTPMDQRWYLIIMATSIAFFRAVNSDPRVLVCAEVLSCWLIVHRDWNLQSVKVLVILPVTRSCLWSTSQDIVMCHPGIVWFGNLGSFCFMK